MAIVQKGNNIENEIKEITIILWSCVNFKQLNKNRLTIAYLLLCFPCKQITCCNFQPEWAKATGFFPLSTVCQKIRIENTDDANILNYRLLWFGFRWLLLVRLVDSLNVLFAFVKTSSHKCLKLKSKWTQLWKKYQRQQCFVLSRLFVRSILFPHSSTLCSVHFFLSSS